MNKSDEYCFVLMPFVDDLNIIYEDIIKPTVNSMGLGCIRADEIDGSHNIVRQIIEHIYYAKIIIADLTGKSANVFYELGISHTLHNNVIVIAKDIQRDVPFDVSNYKVIEYQDSIRGGRRLSAALEKAISTFEEWTDRPSNPVKDFLPESHEAKVPLEEYEGVQKKMEFAEQQLEQAQKQILKYEEDRNDLARLRNQEKELQTLRKLLEQLFQNALPGKSAGHSDFVELMKNVIDELEKQGEISFDVTSQDESEKTPPKKIIFRKVKK